VIGLPTNPARAKGSPFAVKLDRRLAGDKRLTEVVAWWYSQYREWHAHNNITGTGDLSDNEMLLHGLVRAWSLVSKSEFPTEDNITGLDTSTNANADPDVQRSWNDVRKARATLRDFRKQMEQIAQELRRRLDSGEPIEVTRKWFMGQKQVWSGYFADLDPFLQWFVLDITTAFRIWLEQKENPDKPFEEIVRERVAELRRYHPDLAKPIIDRLTKQIEPEPAPRSWAKGAFTVFANGVECFSWAGTKQDAINVQKRCLETVGALGIPPDRYAHLSASYLIAYGVPAAGDADRRPSGLSDQQWSADEALCFRYSILRSALREHASDAGQRLEDVFAGRRFEVRFTTSSESAIHHKRTNER
jgi:hypothetical protein